LTLPFSGEGIRRRIFSVRIAHRSIALAIEMMMCAL
jgi:hypothetical protein